MEAQNLADLHDLLWEIGRSTFTQVNFGTVFELDELSKRVASEMLSRATTARDFSDVAEQILNCALSKEIGSRAESPSSRRFRLGSALRKSLELLSEEARQEAWRPLSVRLEAELDSGQIEAACDMISSLGRNDAHLTRRLLGLWGAEDAASREIVVCLYTLGQSRLPSMSIVHYVRDCILADQHKSLKGFEFLIQELADEDLISVIAATLAVKGIDPAHAKDRFSEAIGLLARTAEAHPQNLRLQEKAWMPIRMQISAGIPSVIIELSFRGDVVPKFNLGAACRDLLAGVAEEWKAGRVSQHGRQIAYYRTLECRGRDVVSDLSPLNDSVLQMICEDATHETDCKRPDLREHRRTALKMAFCYSLDHAMSSIERLVDSVGSDAEALSDVFAAFSTVGLPTPPALALALATEELIIEKRLGDTSWLPKHKAIPLLATFSDDESFEALKNIGHRFANDEALWDVMKALSDVAVARAKLGDDDAPRNLMAFFENPATPKWQRTAAAAAIGALGSGGFLKPDFINHICGLLRHEVFRPAERICLFEAVTNVDRDSYALLRPALLDSLALSQDGRLRGFALTLLVNKDDTADYVRDTLPHLRSLLGSSVSDHELQHESYALGRACMRFPEYAVDLAGQFLSKADRDVSLFLFLKALDDLKSGYSLPDIGTNVVLCAGIHQGPRRACQAVLKLAAQLFPEAFLANSWSSDLQTWMPDARVGLADALGAAKANNEQNADSKFRLLELLTQDDIFAVRRSAWRALSRADSRRLEKMCSDWSKLGTLELQKRAAEGLSWLPAKDSVLAIEQHLKQAIESSARVEAKKIKSTRQARLDLEHFTSMLDAVRFATESSMLEFKVSNALAGLGDDETLETLDAWASDRDIPRFRRNLFTQTRKELKKSWADRTAKWPQPWLPLRGSIEELDANIGLPGFDDGGFRKILLSRSDPRGSEASSGWGATFECLSDTEEHTWFGKEVIIRIKGRSPARAVITQVQNANSFSAVGIGYYPSHGASGADE